MPTGSYTYAPTPTHVPYNTVCTVVSTPNVRLVLHVDIIMNATLMSRLTLNTRVYVKARHTKPSPLCNYVNPCDPSWVTCFRPASAKL